MSPNTYPLPRRRPKLGNPLYPCPLKPSSLLNPRLRMSLKFKICSHWSLARCSTDHLLRSKPGPNPPQYYYLHRRLYTTNIQRCPRKHLTHYPCLTPRSNMVYLNSSRDQPCTFRPDRRRIRVSVRFQCRICRGPLRTIFPRRVRQHPTNKHPLRHPFPRRLTFPHNSRANCHQPNNQSSSPIPTLPMSTGLIPSIPV